MHPWCTGLRFLVQQSAGLVTHEQAGPPVVPATGAETREVGIPTSESRPPLGDEKEELLLFTLDEKAIALARVELEMLIPLGRGQNVDRLDQRESHVVADEDLIQFRAVKMAIALAAGP